MYLVVSTNGVNLG